MRGQKGFAYLFYPRGSPENCFPRRGGQGLKRGKFLAKGVVCWKRKQKPAGKGKAEMRTSWLERGGFWDKGKKQAEKPELPVIREIPVESIRPTPAQPRLSY